MTTALKVRVYGDPCLKEKSKDVKRLDAPRRIFLNSMIKTMYEKEGVGLAAPQVGVNERFFIADIGDGPIAFINPQVLKTYDQCSMEEGCLSVPGVNVKITRPEKIDVKFYDFDFNEVTCTLNGLMARVYLHELDHLDGVTIIDRAPSEQREQLQGLMNAFLAKNEQHNT